MGVKEQDHSELDPVIQVVLELAALIILEPLAHQPMVRMDQAEICHRIELLIFGNEQPKEVRL